MAKHVFRRADEERTELLGHDELFVQKGKGSDTYYNAWLHVEHRNLVPERLFTFTSRLENTISSLRTFSEEVLKARILYSVKADLEHWNGVPLDEVLAVFDQQVHDNGGNE